MKTMNFKMIFLLALLGLTQNSFAGAPTAANYRGVVQGVLSKFDRDYSSLNPKGKPDPGALGTVETFLSAFNSLSIVKPGEYHFFIDDSSPSVQCTQGTAGCIEVKILVRNSQHANDSTLFGVQVGFDWDIVVWMDKGQGFEKFLQGFYSPVFGTAGRANLTLISCSGCSTVGHSQIEWDATGPIYHLRSVMYDTRINQNPEVYAGVVIDAQYIPLIGDMKLAIAANNVCGSQDVGDSICGNNGQNDHTTGYSAQLHANTNTGNVYVIGVQGANNSNVVPTVDAMCLKADKTEDVSGAACQADSIDNFTNMQAYAPVNAPASFIGAGSPWPLAEITDTPLF